MLHRRTRLLAVLFVLAAIGAATAWAVTETTGTVVACAHATVPAQTIAVNGSPIATVPQAVADQCVTTTYTVPTVTVTTTSSPAWPDTTPPAMGTPNRVATDVATLKSILGSLQAGDVVEVKPMTISGEFAIGSRPSAPASIYFDPGVKFVGASSGNAPAVWLHGANLRLYGGDVSGFYGDCVKVAPASSDSSGPSNILWWGAVLHDCGGQGFSTQSGSFQISNLDISMEVYDWGRNLNLDPHPTPGTGEHGAYVGGGTVATTGSRFVFNVHDSDHGAGVQAGPGLQNSDLWIKAANLTWSGTPGMAGNAFQPFGSKNQNVTVHDLEVSNITGHAVFDESLTGGNVTVEYARATGVALSSYESSPYLACLDCQ